MWRLLGWTCNIKIWQHRTLELKLFPLHESQNMEGFPQNSRHLWFWKVIPKCELPKVIIRYNIGPISAAKSRLLLLGQFHCLHRSSAGPDCFNLPTFSRNLAQYRPYTKPIVIFTMASSFESRRARVGLMVFTLLDHVSLSPRQTILEVRKP